MKKIIAIVGPTAVGKSKIALYLAPKYHGEIINADSRQVYRYMDIGTAKPDMADQKLVKHHLLDIVNPDEHFSLAIYQEKALTIINQIQNKGNVPFLVGGTGLYIRAVLDAWKIPHVPPDIDFRENLRRRVEQEGVDSLYNELKLLDPLAANTVQHGNARRIIRALEISHKLKTPVSSLMHQKGERLHSLIIGLTMSRDALYKEIDNRVDEMLSKGFINEVKDLLNMDYKPELPAMSGIGYQQIIRYLHNEMTLEEAVQQIKKRTRRFASRQYNWFRLDDKNIHWFDARTEINDNIDKLVLQFLIKEHRDEN